MAELNNNQETNQGQENTATETKTYTQEELDALIQQATDKRVTQALATQARKNEAKLKEAQKLAQMNEQEKYVYELEQREKAIEEKERQLTLAENKNTAQHILSDKHLDLDLVDFVLAEDAETMNSNITRLERAFKRSVKAEVETILRGKTPPASNSTDATTLTKEKFKNLSLMEKQNLYNTDRELYNQLIS